MTHHEITIDPVSNTSSLTYISLLPFLGSNPPYPSSQKYRINERIRL